MNKPHESLLSRLINFLFFRKLDAIVEKAEQDAKKIPQEQRLAEEKEFQDTNKAIEDLNAKMVNYCAQNPDTPLCKQFLNDGEVFKMRWKGH